MKGIPNKKKTKGNLSKDNRKDKDKGVIKIKVLLS